MFVDQTQCKLPHHFKTSEARAQSLMRQTQQRHSSFHAWHGSPSRQLGYGLRIDFHAGCCDHTQSAFTANHEVTQIVARVVFAQARQAMPNFTLGSDHF